MKKNKLSIFIFMQLFILLTLSVLNANDDISLLNVNKIYGLKLFKTKRVKSPNWTSDGKEFTTLKKTGGINSIFIFRPKNNKEDLLLNGKTLLNPINGKQIKIEDYIYNKKVQKILIFTNSKKVWRTNSRGDYFLYNIRTDSVRKLGKGLSESSLMFAKFSPDGKRIAFVSKGNIYTENIKSGKIIRITNSKNSNVINGTTDWVYEEEFHLKDGFRWSPDGKHIAFWQFDMNGVKNFFMINNTSGIYSKIIPVQYPKAGEVNSACRIGIVDSFGGDPLWLKISGSMRDNYIPNMWWHPNSKYVYFLRLNRKQNHLYIYSGNISSGNIIPVYEEKSDTWIELYEGFNWIAQGEYFTWVSEEDGWRHIYLISSDGQLKKLLTKGKFDIISINAIDYKKGWIYFSASPNNPTQKYLFRTGLYGKKKTSGLTPDNFKGYNSYNISPGGKYAFHKYSNFVTPESSSLIKTLSHKIIRILENNIILKKKIALLKRGNVDFINITLKNKINLNAWMMKPWDFSKNKKYPVLLYVYGEPWSQTVLDKWGGDTYLWHLMMTQKNYIVLSIDNRGTPAPKGAKFRKSIYKKIGMLNIKDQAESVLFLLNKFSYLDNKKVFVWGWSGGGSSTLNLIFKYPEIFKTGVSVAPVTDLHLYDSIYEERYMGLPLENKKAYKNGSAINFVDGLRGNLLLIHGTGDDNVHYQNSEMLINRLIEKKKLFSFMPYPNRTHSIRQGKNTRVHLFDTITDFLIKNL